MFLRIKSKIGTLIVTSFLVSGIASTEAFTKNNQEENSDEQIKNIVKTDKLSTFVSIEIIKGEQIIAITGRKYNGSKHWSEVFRCRSKNQRNMLDCNPVVRTDNNLSWQLVPNDFDRKLSRTFSNEAEQSIQMLEQAIE